METSWSNVTEGFIPSPHIVHCNYKHIDTLCGLSLIVGGNSRSLVLIPLEANEPLPFLGLCGWGSTLATACTCARIRLCGWGSPNRRKVLRAIKKHRKERSQRIGQDVEKDDFHIAICYHLSSSHYK